jgi:hypothetical protein
VDRDDPVDHFFKRLKPLSGLAPRDETNCASVNLTEASLDLFPPSLFRILVHFRIKAFQKGIG